MKKIYYFGFYEDDICPSRKNAHKNLAGSMKMNFIIHSLKRLGYKVILVAIMFDEKAGYHRKDHIFIDEQEERYYIPYYSIKVGNRNRGSVITAIPFLRKFVEKRVTSNDIVINYHALPFKSLFADLRKKIGYRWILQIEEIYYYSRKEKKDKSQLLMEERMISGADGYLFVNDYLPTKYSEGKKYAVSYGNYHVFSNCCTPVVDDQVNIVYTGVIAKERGIFSLLDAMDLLPDNYHLNVLGFGTDENMNFFNSRVSQVNKKRNRVSFHGTKSGKEYSEFLNKNHIGIGLIDLSEEIMYNAFPSKIMAYLGHSLNVVSSKCSSIENSRISDMLYLCDNSPEGIANAIKSVKLNCNQNIATRLKELENQFIYELSQVIVGE